MGNADIALTGDTNYTYEAGVEATRSLRNG